MLKAEDKLGEAKFFLEKMQATHGEPREFDYYLNAFISSCRSVQWVLSSQFNKDSSLKEWLESQRPTDEERNILKATNELRVRSTKKESISTDKMAILAFDPSQLYHLSEEEFIRLRQAFESGDFSNLTLQFHHQDEGYSTENPPEGRVFIPITQSKAFRQVAEFPNEDILEVAEKYFVAMESLVSKARCKIEGTA